MADQTAELDWIHGCIPVSRRFDDPYFSIENGLAETRHVFLGGNRLPERFTTGFSVAELGFGSGLNLLTTWKAWLESGQRGSLNYTSFEAYPMRRPDMSKALAGFSEVEELASALLAAWPTEPGPVHLHGLRLEIIMGDARQNLPAWTGMADAWYLDGFSPAKNPQLWEPELLAEVARHTRPGGSFATYTAAGHVRRSLERAGFAVERRPGFGRKRHMTTGKLVGR